jgi:hypothetical protein
MMAARPRKRDGSHTFLYRIRWHLWQRLRAEAERQKRSATAQLDFILEERYGPPPEEMAAKGHRQD